MMRQFYAIFLIFSLIFLSSCSTQITNSDSINRQWMMVAYRHYSKDFLLKTAAQLDLSTTKSPENQYTANMGCNKLFLKAKFYKNGTVEFSDLGGTQMYCEENMELEDMFSKELPTMKNYRIDGHFLYLDNGQGNVMKFIAADWD